MKLPKLHLLCFFIAIGITHSCLAKDVVLDSAYKFTDINPPDKLIISLQDIRLLPHKNQDFNFHITNDYCYLLIKLQADHLLNAYALSVENTSLDTVFIYQLSGNGNKQLVYRGGNHIPFDSKRFYVWHTVSLTIPIQPGYYLIGIKDQSKNVNIAYSIMPETLLKKRYQFFDRLIYFYLGVISLIIAASVIGFFLFKRKELLIFPGYIVSVTTWILAHYGYLYANLYALYFSINEIAKPFSIISGVLFLLWLLTKLFDANLKGAFYQKPLFLFKLFNLLLLGIGLFYLIRPLPLLAFTIYNIVWHVSLLFSVCLISVTLLWLYKRSRPAKLFFFSVCAVLIMALFQTFANIGIFHSSSLSDHGILLASLIQILVLTYGIFYSIWEDKKEMNRQLLLLEEEQTKALQLLVQVQERERKRIAEDLHDSIGPMLAAIKINFLRIIKAKGEMGSFNELVAKTESIIDDTSTEIRNVSHQLMPKNLSSKGLITVLSDYFEDLETIYNTTIYFTHEVTNSIHKEVQLNLYRIISELVLNAAKHSCSKIISVSIKTTLTAIYILVKDSGKGFKPIQNNNTSLGLKNIGSRIAYMKGSLAIESSKESGTLIEIAIPQQV